MLPLIDWCVLIAEAEATIGGQTAEQTDRRTGRKGTMFLPEGSFFLTVQKLTTNITSIL